MSMEARSFGCKRNRFIRSFWCCCLIPMLMIAMGARYETANFSVENAPTSELAREFCETAERCRHDLALLWLGRTMPNWSAKCPIKVTVGETLGAGGATTFIFQGGEVYGWEMDIQGSAPRILDSVLPHEITHMIFASHFRRPVPRWLDEGAATSVEHESEKENYRKMLRHFIRKDVRKCLPCRRMIALKEYPEDVMPFYAQGFSIVEYLLFLNGPRELVRFAETGMESDDWDTALATHYGFENLGDFQANYWVKWVAAGSPASLSEELQPNRSLLIGRKDSAEPQENILMAAYHQESSFGDRVGDSVLLTSHAGLPLPGAGEQVSRLPAQLSSGRVPPPSPIELVSAKPSPQYGRWSADYDGIYHAENINRVNRVDGSRNPVAPIPTSFETDSNSVTPIPASGLATSGVVPALLDSTAVPNMIR